MTATTGAKHPCLHREALSPWENDHLYLGDEGRVLCGRCMGIESTYTPWAFSDLGRMDGDRKVVIAVPPLPDASGRRLPPVPTAFRCEVDEAHRRKLTNPRRDA